RRAEFVIDDDRLREGDRSDQERAGDRECQDGGCALHTFTSCVSFDLNLDVFAHVVVGVVGRAYLPVTAGAERFAGNSAFKDQVLAYLPHDAGLTADPDRSLSRRRLKPTDRLLEEASRDVDALPRPMEPGQ